MTEKELNKLISLIKSSYKKDKNVKRFISNKKYHINIITNLFNEIKNHQYILVKDNINKNIFSYFEVRLFKGVLIYFNQKDNLLNFEDIKYIADKLYINESMIKYI